jgi:hypothetical protein
MLQVAYKKRERAQKRKEMEVLMKDNLLNILTVPGTPIRSTGCAALLTITGLQV